MPTYEFMCQACQEPFEKLLRMSEYEQPQVCPACGSSDTYRKISLSSFVLKGDGWTSKDLRAKGQMTRRNNRMGQKMKDHVAPKEKLVPNVGGEQVDTWSEAKKLAASKGKDASSYDALVHKETRGET